MEMELTEMNLKYIILMFNCIKEYMFKTNEEIRTFREKYKI